MNTFFFYSILALLSLQVNRMTLAFQPPSSRTSNHVRLENSRLQMSVPNAIDTLTSGLASIVRVGENGLAGVTVSSNANAEEDISLKLFDIENSSSCRTVRELITELDLVVEKVIPATPNSRATQDPSFEFSLPPGAQVPCLVASFPEGEEKVISGVAACTDFLTETFSDEPTGVENESTPLQQTIEAVTPATMFVAGLLRTGRGSDVSPAVKSSIRVNKPKQSLILYSYEGNQFCRLVREVLTELDIVSFWKNIIIFLYCQLTK